MKKYRAYVFDIDGVILDTSLTILDCIKKAVESNGFSLEERLIDRTLIGPKIAEIVDNLGLSKRKDNIVRKFRELYDNSPWINTRVYSQGMNLLREVKDQGSDIFIATNKPKLPTYRLFEYFSLDGFKEIYTPDKYEGKTSSKTDMLAEIIDVNHFSPAEILFIGDTEGDLNAAIKNKCDFAFASWGYAKNKDEMIRNSTMVLE